MPEDVADDLGLRLNEWESEFFFQRKVGRASGDGYIASNTWRAFRSSPYTSGIPSRVLMAVFDEPLKPLFQDFLLRYPTPTRDLFDEFHSSTVDALYGFLQSHHPGIVVYPAAVGMYHGRAYNSYAKVGNLAYTHWCFRPQPNTGRVEYPPSTYPHLRHCLHVPLDVKVLAGIRKWIAEGLLPLARVPIPHGSMGSIRSQQHYGDIQNYLRSVADRVESANFPGDKVSPLAFEGLWEPGEREKAALG